MKIAIITDTWGVVNGVVTTLCATQKELLNRGHSVLVVEPSQFTYFNLPWYVTQPMREQVDLTLGDEALMRTLEAHARSLPGFEPHERWRARMAERMGVAQ